MTQAVQYLTTTDRISNLPRNVLDDILMSLPSQEAGRTSILSKIWSRRWANIPQLVFNDSFNISILQRAPQPTHHDLIMKIVYKVLLLHSGPLHKFNLSIYGLESSPDIDSLILFLSEKDIQDFTLWIRNYRQLNDHKLPSCFFSFLLPRRLNPRSFIFNPPRSFKGFSKLVNLELSDVLFDADHYKNFISSCPLLESLTLARCTEISFLEFNAHSLKSIDYSGFYRIFCFKTSPVLAYLSIHHRYNYSGINMLNLIDLSSCLPAVEFLDVDNHFLKTNNLQNPSTDDRFLRVLELESHMDFSLNQLQEEELLRFNGTIAEMELAKFFLAKSSALKK